MNKTIIAACVLGGACAAAQAQSSVTLYGIVDNGIAWQNSAASLGSTAGGHSLVLDEAALVMCGGGAQ